MKASFKELSVEVTKKYYKKAPWSSINNNNYHLMTVHNNETGRMVQFDFWTSNSYPELENEYDLLNALYCFVGDALSGDMEYSEFCGGYGYEEGSIEADNTYEGCVAALGKLEYLYGGDIYDLANELGEDYA